MKHKIQTWTACLSNGSQLTEGAVRIENEDEFELLKVNLKTDAGFRADDALELAISPEQ